MICWGKLFQSRTVGREETHLVNKYDQELIIDSIINSWYDHGTK